MPRIKTTPTVKIALYSLSVYLVLLLSLLVYRFIKTI